LCQGDIISIKCKEELFDVEVIRCRPNKAIGIIDTNLSIEFLPPKDLENIRSKDSHNDLEVREEVCVEEKLKVESGKINSYDPRIGMLTYAVLFFN